VDAKRSQRRLLLLRPHLSNLWSLATLNIRLDKHSDHAATSQFLSLLSSINWTQHVNFPTHNQNHVMDLVITSSDSSLAPSLYVTHCCPSDHFSIFAKLINTKGVVARFTNVFVFAYVQHSTRLVNRIYVNALCHLVLWSECHWTTGRPGRLIIRSQWCDAPSVVSVPPIFTAPRHLPRSPSSTTDSTTHVDVRVSRDSKSKRNSSLKVGLDELCCVFVLLLPSFSPALSNHTLTNVPAHTTFNSVALLTTVLRFHFYAHANVIF